MVAVTLVALLGCAALAIDIGHLQNVRAELQVSADAGAMAAASQLPNEEAATAAGGSIRGAQSSVQRRSALHR